MDLLKIMIETTAYAISASSHTLTTGKFTLADACWNTRGDDRTLKTSNPWIHGIERERGITIKASA